MRTRTVIATLALGVALATLPAEAPPAAGAIRLARVGSFDSPTYLTAPRGSRVRQFVTEREGVIRVRRNGRNLRRPFLDIRRLVGTDGEGGLLSMAFAPGYNRNRRFYVYFTAPNGDVHIEEFKRSRRSRDRADRRSRRRVLVQRHRAFGNHKGGQLQFGRDRLLYAAIGDGGGGGDPFRAAQDLGTLLGKLIRIDPRRSPSGRGYRIPRGNPFRAPGGARAEIYGYGLRNPYRFSFDRRTGNLALSDVGQSAVEEVNYLRRRPGRQTVRAAVNFGWSFFEGRRRFRAGIPRGFVLRPALQQLHPGFCSIIGGYIVRDRRLVGLRGRYVYGDLCNDRLHHARLRHPRAFDKRRSRLRVNRLVSFGEDAFGRLYAVSLDGPVFRLVRR